MLKGLLSKVVGDSNEREIQKLQPMVTAINNLEPDMERRTDAELRSLTDQFRARLASGTTLDELLVEVFAAVREVGKRTVDMRAFDVQLIGGIVLHQGKVAEMRTGEGKTLVATMPVYLNALKGRGVHLVTVNDYLARRDALWMGPIYHLMGLSVGLLQSGAEQPAYLYDPAYQREPYPGLRPVPRRQAYAADITYGTNNEFGFDYLRDNLALSLERRVQRPLYYAIVDEVDNIFIDEARTPLIISGPSGEPVEEYSRFAAIARKLETEVHYELDEKERSVYLTDEGLAVVEQETGIENIYDEANYRYVHYMQQALKAQVLFLEGRDYIRQRKQIILIDHHTGRLMPNRRLSEGLHQAIEAKEGVSIRPRDVTSATITIQNYFRMYEKLAGMSGTAVTESEEFFKIYNLDVLAIPTNKPVIRTDRTDTVYRSEEAKQRAVAREIVDCFSRGQPVLVGTTSVENSERLSRRLSGERLQMAALAPRIAYGLQDSELGHDEQDELRQTMNDSLETMNSAAWRRLARAVGVNHNALSPENLDWIINYLDLPDEPSVHRALDRAFREGIDHQILNAKEHTREAAIIARAGEPGAVTIATNMAGRGVDIKLGGELSDEVIHRAHQALRGRGLDPFNATPAQMDSAIAEVVPQYAKRRERALAAGGLHVLGTERHEARRIDNQLRGRSGRQGEPGSSRFYLSLEDDLMRRFGRREMLSKLMETIGDDFPIEHNLVSKTLERAQTSVEGYNFDIRKHLLEYDDVLNRQRETIYGERLRILQSDDLQNEVWRMLEGQVDEYLEKYGEDSDQARLLFAGLDDIMPLLLPSPSAPFQGPLAFGGHLTAFPPFSISFLADQFRDQPLDRVQRAFDELAQRAAVGYGEYVRRAISETAQATLDKYEERLDRYRTLLDEKIEDYLQLLEERGQSPDIRRLAQHLERTYPLPLTLPPGEYQLTMDDLHDHWQGEIEVEFHRQTIAGLIERVQIRLPEDIRLDRLQPARIPSARVADEMHRVRDLSLKQARDDAARRQLETLSPSAEPTANQVLEFADTIKRASNLDYGRLDRLIGHVLGVQLDDLLGQYLAVVTEEQGLLRRDLERLRGTLAESKKGRRTNSLLNLLSLLNNLVHLEIPDLEVMLDLAVAHEYDKWAQRQLAEIETDVEHHPLTSTTWSSIAEHLLATHYTQKQAYDRGHRRRTLWMPRLSFSFMAQAHIAGMNRDSLKAEILDSLHWAVQQREQTWGEQESQRWAHLSLLDLTRESRDSLIRYLGKQELGEQRERMVDDLSPEIYGHLRFVLALRQVEDRRLAELPNAAALLAHLGEALEAQLLDTPLGELDDPLQEHIGNYLRQARFLDDATARERLLAQPIQDWDRRTRSEVAGLLGHQAIKMHAKDPISELPLQMREATTAFLQRQRAFVDEDKVQRFLVHQSLNDLPLETHQAALAYLARTRLDRVQRRKISNLDVKTREVVTESLQRAGLFTDRDRRDGLLSRSLADLEPDVRTGFGVFLARQNTEEHALGELEEPVRRHVIERLKQTDVLADPDQLQGLAHQRLGELDKATAAQIRDELVNQLRVDLASKTMEELPAETRHRAHRALEERNYFVDQEKVGWYERNTLAQLSPDLLRGLEQHLGRIRLAELAEIPFQELPSATQNSLLDFLEEKKLLADRAERLRLSQTGNLGQLSDGVRDAVAQHLGRQWSVQIRNQRPPSLPDDTREEVWVYLRDQGHFVDEFKEELFAFQRLEEFGEETCQAVEGAMVDHLTSMLDTLPIGDLPLGLQADIRSRLRRAGFFIDKALLRQIEESPRPLLPPDLGQAIETTLADLYLEEIGATPIGQLAAEMQAALWRHLDETGYFLDEHKLTQMLDRRLADLGTDLYETVVQDMIQDLAEEIGDQPVSELDDELRQGLREAVESAGYFESEQHRAGALSQPVEALRREDLEALADELGEMQLELWGEKRLADLPLAEQQTVLAHLQAHDWFLDRERYDRLQEQRLRDLEDSNRQELLDALRQQMQDDLRQQRLGSLQRGQRQIASAFLRKSGLAADENTMRGLRRRRLDELDQDLYQDLLRHLGTATATQWGTTRFQDLDEKSQIVLRNYVGRRIMGNIERRILLHTISRLWVDYLTDIEDLRRGIGLEAYGQRDPLVEYKRRAFELFEELGDNIRRTVVRSLFRQPPEPLVTQTGS